MDDLQRRPNPPGWVQPREGSHYNPYDPTDKRPPGGYPSEFNTPGRESSWSSIPKNASQYRQMRETMKRLEYTPRPLSDLYKGQFKQLRRVDNYAGFHKGVQITAKLFCFGIISYGCFFHRWNDGYENIFSDLYRMQLQWKYQLLGKLSDDEMEDLNPKYRRTFKVARYNVDNNSSLQDTENAEDTGMALERPQKKHLIEAQRILQDREERLMRAVDIAEEELKKTASSSSSSSKKSWW